MVSRVPSEIFELFYCQTICSYKFVAWSCFRLAQLIVYLCVRTNLGQLGGSIGQRGGGWYVRGDSKMLIFQDAP